MSFCPIIRVLNLITQLMWCLPGLSIIYVTFALDLLKVCVHVLIFSLFLFASCLLVSKDSYKARNLDMSCLNSITIHVAMQPFLHPVQTPLFHLARKDTLVVSWRFFKAGLIVSPRCIENLFPITTVHVLVNSRSYQQVTSLVLLSGFLPKNNLKSHL